MKLTQIELVKKLEELGPKTDYFSLLKSEFDVEVPDGMPLYRQEYLYKYCLQEVVNETPVTDIVSNANAALDSFIKKFPHIVKKYDEVSNPNIVTKGTKLKGVPDNTVIHKPKNDRYYYWTGGVVTVSSKNVEGLNKCLLKKYGAVPKYEIVVKE